MKIINTVYTKRIELRLLPFVDNKNSTKKEPIINIAVEKHYKKYN